MIMGYITTDGESQAVTATYISRFRCFFTTPGNQRRWAGPLQEANRHEQRVKALFLEGEGRALPDRVRRLQVRRGDRNVPHLPGPACISPAAPIFPIVRGLDVFGGWHKQERLPLLFVQGVKFIGRQIRNVQVRLGLQGK